MKTGRLLTIGFVDFGLSDANGPVLAADFSVDATTWQPLWDDLLRKLPSCDAVVLDKLVCTIRGRPNPVIGIETVRVQPYGTHAIDLARGIDDWRSNSLRASKRKSNDVGRRRLARRGRLDFVEAASQAEMQDLMTVLLDYRAQRFRALGREDVLQNPSFRQFVETLLSPPSPDVVPTLAALKVDGHPVAVAFGLRQHDHFYLSTFGFDPAFSAGSPAFVLLEWMIETAAGKGLRWFDFTIGDEPYKAELGCTRAPLYSLICSRSWRGLPLSTSFAAKRWLDKHPNLKSAVVRRRDAAAGSMQAIRQALGLGSTTPDTPYGKALWARPTLW